MKRSIITPTLFASMLSLVGCATAAPPAVAEHPAPTLGGPPARVVELPASAGTVKARRESPEKRVR